MTIPTFKISDGETVKYKIHGIAHLKLNQVVPIPESGCDIDITDLLGFETPRYCWLKEAPKAPEVIIASSKATSVPKDAVQIDPAQQLDCLVVRYWHNHPRKEYTDAKIEPRYK